MLTNRRTSVQGRRRFSTIHKKKKNNEFGGRQEEEKPVAETFEDELEQIKENGKELKGTNKAFYESIVQRIDNNCKALKSLREDHTALRAKLGELVGIRKKISQDFNLDQSIKRILREVNHLMMQIDRVKHKREVAISRQTELKLMLDNLTKGHDSEHPELIQITELKNKLDKALIKIDESKHLARIYEKILVLFDKQKLKWDPLLKERQISVSKKDKDISELFLISRDSMHSQVTAKNEYTALANQVNEIIMKQEKELEMKELQYNMVRNAAYPDGASEDQKRSKLQHSIASQSSLFRSRQNKASREMREEKIRQWQAKLDKIYSVFETTDPHEIASIVSEREKNAAALNKQIKDLKEEISILERKKSLLQIEIEEKEYTQAIGVGGRRLHAEGEHILQEKLVELAYTKRTIEASEEHRKKIEAGTSHMLDIVGLVTSYSEELPYDTVDILSFCLQKAKDVRSALESNDEQSLASLVNPTVFAQLKQEQNQYDMAKVDSSKRILKRSIDPIRRQLKDSNNEDSNRVLDRNAVKLLAQKVIAEKHLIKKPVLK